MDESNFSRDEIKEIKAKSVKICALNKDTASHNKSRISLGGQQRGFCQGYHGGYINVNRSNVLGGSNVRGPNLYRIKQVTASDTLVANSKWVTAIREAL